MTVVTSVDLQAAPRPSSQLVYRESAGDASLTIVAVHGLGGDARQLEELCESLALRGTIAAPQAARPCNPLLGGGNRGGAYGGYRWFLQTADARPEPATFGDSLMQLERFLDDVSERYAGRPLVLLGLGEGAALALALAHVAPERVAGVVALQSAVPDVPGWPVPEAPLNGMPILLLAENREAIEQSAGELATRGAQVVMEVVTGVAAHPQMATAHIDCFFARWLSYLSESA